jgi:hypothetical protein
VNQTHSVNRSLKVAASRPRPPGRRRPSLLLFPLFTRAHKLPDRPSARARSAQFPHLILPILGFALIGLCTLCIALRLEYTTRQHDDRMAMMLRKDGLSAATPSIPPPISPQLSPHGHSRSHRPPTRSPPPSPPSDALLGTMSTRAQTLAPSQQQQHEQRQHEQRQHEQRQHEQQHECLQQQRRPESAARPVAERLVQLKSLQEEGLLEDDEYSRLRRAILAAI